MSFWNIFGVAILVLNALMALAFMFGGDYSRATFHLVVVAIMMIGMKL